MAVDDESAWFDANRAFIAQQYNGQWLVVKDKAIKGAYNSYADAYKAGAAMFGKDFLVEQALAEKPVLQAPMALGTRRVPR